MNLFSQIENSDLPLTEDRCQEILKNSEFLTGYKDLNGVFEGISDTGLRVFTKRVFQNKKEVIGKFEMDLFSKEHRKHVELYLQHDRAACQNRRWYGIEPIFLDGGHTFAEVTKNAVLNQTGEVIGNIFHLKKISSFYTNSMWEILKFFNANSDLKSHQSIEFFKPDAAISLTPREIECLFYTLRGKSAKAIGLILKISPKTIEFHLEHIKTKFNCRNKMELISKAMELGYLNKITPSIIAALSKGAEL
jgi:DNA-binding CsgD family transcriptional regulator